MLGLGDANLTDDERKEIYRVDRKTVSTSFRPTLICYLRLLAHRALHPHLALTPVPSFKFQRCEKLLSGKHATEKEYSMIMQTMRGSKLIGNYLFR